MLKRIAIVILLLLMLLASGIVIQTSPMLPTLPLPSAQSITAASAERSAVWVEDGRGNDFDLERLVAIEPQTGEVLIQISPPPSYGETVTSTDRRWQYAAEFVLRGGSLALQLSVIDLHQGTINKRISVSRSRGFMLRPSRDPSVQDPFVQLALSKDNRLLVVTVIEDIGTAWHTEVYLADTATGRAKPRFGFFAPDATKPRPRVSTFVSDDAGKVLIAQSRRSEATTQIASLNGGTGMIEGIQDIATEFQPLDFGFNLLSSDGQRLYGLQHIFDGQALTGHHFVAVDINKLEVVFTRHIGPSTSLQIDADSEPFCDWNPRLTANERYFFGYCERNSKRLSGYFQFLDTQAGRVTKRVPLERRVASPEGDDSDLQMIVSPDNTFLYVLSPETSEMTVLDLERQAIVRSAILKDSKRAWRDALRGIAALLVSTANAKGERPRPRPAISPDGQRLYFVNVSSEKGGGIWGVETSSLNVLGHWLTDKDIIGVQVSADGRELYALSTGDHILYVLDAFSGDVRRAFDKVLQRPLGFAPLQE